MRKFLVTIIIATIIICIILGLGIFFLRDLLNFEIPVIDFSNNNTQQDKANANYENRYFEDSELGVKFIVTKKIPKLIINDDREKFAKDVLEESNFSLGINGGYFLPDWSHAGLLEINGNVIVREAPNDKQVTGLVLINSDGISIEKVEDVYQVNAQTVFQTGPIIILDNQIQTTAISSAPNGPGKYLRSFIGTTTDGEIIIGISTKFITLDQLADFLVRNEYLKEKTIDIINLDGGSSVFIYSKENLKFQTNIYRTLPFILGF